MDPTAILVHKFHADAHVKISHEDYAASAGKLLAAVKKAWGVSFDSVDEMLERAGWDVEREEDAVVLTAGDGNMFSGRWQDERVSFLGALAEAGYEGWVTVHSYDDDLRVDYNLCSGTLSATSLTPKKVSDVDPAQIYGDKFHAGGNLTITRKSLAASSEELLAELNRTDGASHPTVEKALDAAGWLVFVNGQIFEPGPLGRTPGSPPRKPMRPRSSDVIELSAGDFGMFSGRWRKDDVEHLRVLANAGFEGGITITGEEGLEVEYTLSKGTVTAEAWVMEFMEDEDERVDEVPSPSA